MAEGKQWDYVLTDFSINETGNINLINKPYAFRPAFGRNMIPKKINDVYLFGDALCNYKIVNTDKAIPYELEIKLPFKIKSPSWIEVNPMMIVSFVIQSTHYAQAILSERLKNAGKFVCIPPEVNIPMVLQSIKTELQQASN